MVAKKVKKTKDVVIYQAKSVVIGLRGDFGRETVWANLDQIAELFGRDKSVVSRHLKNIFNEKELNKISVVAKNATTATDGKIYQVEYYNLDAILSVGYRVNSKTATQFRQWATKTLRSHIIDGYTINKSRIAQNYDAFMKTVADVRVLLHATFAK
ncbi:MAG: RhuM family protein [Minisyncoccia bacterium]